MNEVVGNYYKSLAQNSTVAEDGKPKSETAHSPDNSHHYSKSIKQEIDTKSEKISKNGEKAELAINRFIKTVESEIQNVALFQGEIEQLSSTAEKETYNISITFLKEVIDSYRNFQYKMNKSLLSSKNKSERPNDAPATISLKQGQSIRSSPSNPYFSPINHQKGSSIGTPKIRYSNTNYPQ